ncbi:hypothetical protein [Thermosipho melanesiensis]|uniref:Transglycosylase SLT domain-containing protein n=2 Tax=Thermosipho melanesiensis TaxID=46541 RepID=A6LKG1_THEM4|nr:hypothetical protein [Thermosipho melanesiensis]ABR30412.1 hypothetical protein Tmel_0545 [Thermosipho melanesiensis BI429]APT73572.1 hypothetical protein BW47_02905 [Thermosipho melanesiensis]
MRKITLLIIAIFSLIAFSNNMFKEAYQYTYKVAKYYGVSEQRARLIACTVSEEYEKFPQVPYQIFVALIVSESGFKNLYGDSGHAVGYCQLHKSAVDYVTTFFPSLKDKIKNIPHDELIKFPRLQIRIAYRYLYLILKNITNYNIVETLNFWNNSSNYYLRVFNTLTFIDPIGKK